MGGVFLLGCSALVQRDQVLPDPLALEQALAGRALLGQPYQVQQLPEVELFALTAEMVAFADRAVAGKRGMEAKAEALHHQLMLPQENLGRGITYSAYTTNTAREAFESRQANCLSYTLLYVAMARHLGLNAQYNEVMLPPTWDMRGDDTYLFMRHVNAKVVLPKLFRSVARLMDVSSGAGEDIVVDLEMRRFHASYKQRPLSEAEMAAQFYSNRGMELAAGGDARGGFLHLRKALLLDDKASYIWSNLGTIYRRAGLLTEAEAAYLQGLSLNAGDFSVMHNLVGLYRDQGNLEKAEVYRQKVRRHRNANPYYQYKLAQDKFDAQNYAGARQAIEKALKQERKDPRLYRLAEQIYLAQGDAKAAARMRKWLDKND